MYIKEYNDEDFNLLKNLLDQHGTIARRTISDFSFDNFRKNLSHPNVKTYCFFKDEKLLSFMISSLLSQYPTWMVRLVCSHKTNYFSPKKFGICDLYNQTIEYWESQGIYNFIYIQPAIFNNKANQMTRDGSVKLQEYVPHDYCLIESNKESKYDFIKKLVDNKTFPDDMLVRWCFKNEK